MKKYTFCSSLSLLILLSSFNAHTVDIRLSTEDEDKMTDSFYLPFVGRKRSREPDENTLAHNIKKRKLSNEQGVDTFEHYPPYIELNAQSGNYQYYTAFRKAVMEKPDDFQKDSDQYKTLLRYVFGHHIQVDLEALGLMPDINKVDVSNGTISDFDRHCLWYLIVHKIDQVRSILPQLKANTNDDSSLYLLGLYYRCNTEASHDDGYKKEVLSYIQAMEKRSYKSPHLLNLLSHLYLDGQFIEKDEEKSFGYMEQAAKIELPKILNNLAVKYLNGQGVPQDYIKAIECFQKAANQGSASAQNNLALHYKNGLGVPQDYAIAIEYFQRAADQGYALAQYGLGLHYKNGLGVPQDYAKAIEYFQRAADQGDANAQNGLGLSYQQALGVPQDYAKAIEYFQKAADQGYDYAQFNLGALYYKGQGISQDYVKAFEWFEKSADQGHTKALNMLAEMYEKGQAVSQSDEKALELYEKAAHHGNSGAQQKLGSLYFSGKIVLQSYAKAIEWFEKAANQNLVNAQICLGILYGQGRDVARDYAKAIKWFERAAEQGDAFAVKNLHSLYSCSGQFQGLEKAEYWRLKGLNIEDRFSIERKYFPGLWMAFQNKFEAEAVREVIEIDIDWLIGIFGLFEGKLHFDGKNSDLDQKFFSHVNDQLATMKDIFKSYTSPDFMNPYMNVSQNFNRKSLDSKRSKKWLGVYRYQNAEFWNFGNEANDLSAPFIQILNDSATEEYLKKAAPSMKKSIVYFSKGTDQEVVFPKKEDDNIPDVTDQEVVFLNESNQAIGDIADLYSAIKQRFVEFMLVTADLRNPRFQAK